MSQLRNHTNCPLKRRAHEILDGVRAGLNHPAAAIAWALSTLGEPVNA